VTLAILLGTSVPCPAGEPARQAESSTIPSSVPTGGPATRPAGPEGHGTFRVELAPPAFPVDMLLPDSPFGVNNAFGPGAKDLKQRLEGFQQVGIKWGRQDFTWRGIEKEPGQYDWAPYDKLVDECLKHGLRIFGDLAYAPRFHDPRTPEGVKAYAAFAAAAAARYKGKVDHWQIWNEPNGGFWNGTGEQYAAILAAAGKAIHQANPQAKVLGLNMAFCDVIWAEKVLKLVPYDCFDIACFHPYRVMGAPEDRFDWWMLDQYVKAWKSKDLDGAPLDGNYHMVYKDFLQQTEELVKVMRKFGQPKPLWVTEICWNTNIHPYGTPEIRQADMVVRFYTLAIASRRIEKVFWWTFRDCGARQYDMADMVGLVRADYEPKYSYYSYAFMTRMLEGRTWVRNEHLGPDVWIVVFHDEKTDQDIMVAWANKPYAYVRVNNTEKGLTFYDVFGTRRFVPYDRQRTGSLPVPLGQSPIYIVGPKGLKANLRPDPGW
jgi:hypothetical protein